MDSSRPTFILGIDLGSASLGWALVELAPDSEPTGLLTTGVRVFDPGVDESDGSIERGADKSKNVARREARLHRRQLRRHAARHREIFELLQSNGLLPPYREPTFPFAGLSRHCQLAAKRHATLECLDCELYSRWRERIANENPGVPAVDHTLPYVLRARALDTGLEPFELGRVIYHLSQRRGFKSNRREGTKSKEKQDEKSQVKAGISELQAAITQSGARTLGEYFAWLQPEVQKLRRRWTARDMFEGEFDAIWSAQKEHHPTVLTDDLRKKVRRLLFWQRPIGSQAGRIGECELERGRKRAPMACLTAQRFRLLQKVNDLEVISADLSHRKLDNAERAKLLEAIEIGGDLTFSGIRALLGLPKRGCWFNLERGGEKKIPGNRTNAVMKMAFEETWDAFPVEKKDEIVEHWRTIENPASLKRRAMQHWSLAEDKAEWLSEQEAEDGYCSLSRQALAKILPRMEHGISFKTAETEIYGDRFSGGQIHELLPPVRKAIKELRNPAVERALSELRKVVNAVVRQYGKPHEVHIELARDLKRSRKDREEAWKAMRQQEKVREEAKRRILREIGIREPSRDDIEKALLHEECGGICPYTGKNIGFDSLFGEHPQFDVEHILPLSRFPDNSFANKTLCYHEENRSVKRGRTPFEAYGANDERWNEILLRVKKWGKRGKLERFEIKSAQELEDFSARQLADTRYSSKMAAGYLGSLYGGRDIARGDGTSRRVIHSCSGKITADLRRNWGLESILRETAPSAGGQSKGKPRSDHRHHAIDAIVIALSSPSAVKALSDSAAYNAKRGRTSFRGVEAPWPDFVESIRPHIEELKVSHRPEHKLSGQLHDETNYGKPYSYQKKPCVHIRKPVAALSSGDIENIVDPEVKNALEGRLQKAGGDLKKLQADEAHPPVLVANDGRKIPIKRVRIRKFLTTESIGQGPRERQVSLANNHHMEIVAELDEKGNEIRWDGVPVSLFEAMQRKRKRAPIVQHNHGGGHIFKFSLMGKDVVELMRNGKKEFLVARTVASSRRILFVQLNDARKKDEIKAAGGLWFPGMDALRKLHARKIVVDVLGKVHPAND